MGMIDLNQMNLQDLRRLQKDVTRAIETFEERQRQEARAALEAKARELGFTLTDLVETGRKSQKKVNPPKYRHPENPNVTWSGRGRQPQWIKDHLAAGGDLSDYLI